MSVLLSTITGVTFSAPSPKIYTRAVPVTFSHVVSSTELSALGVPYQEVWQFGDGQYSYESVPTHIYSEKGVYPVTYTTIIPSSATGEVNDEIRTVTTTVSVFNFLEDAISWSNGTPATYQSVPQDFPFTISLSSSNVNTVAPFVQLYSRGSQSQPWQDPQQKWSHLKPQWRFTDVNGTVISSVQPDTYTTITIDQSGNRTFDDSGTVVGLSANVQCFYVDDLPSQNIDNSVTPVTLVATLITSGYEVTDNTVKFVPSYINSPIKSETNHNIIFLQPDHLKVTVNGITPMNDIIWRGAYTPYTVTVHPPAPYDNVILKNFPLTSFIVNSFSQNLNGIASSNVEFSDTVTLTRFDADGFDTGGYFRGTFYPLVSSDSTHVVVDGTVVYGTLAEPFGAWVSNPYFHQLVYITVQDVSTGTQFLSTVYTIPNSQIYGIARVTGDINDASWVTDPTNDKIYRISRSFGLDSTFDLTTYPDFSAVIANNDYGLTPTGIVLNSSKQVWVTLFDGVSTVKFDPNNGNVLAIAVPPFPSMYVDIPGISGFGGDDLLRPTKVDVDTNDNIWVAYNHPLSSVLVKYQNDGTYITQVDLPLYSKPYDLVIDRQNNFWVTLSYTIDGLSGQIVKYDTDGNQLSSIDGFESPSTLTLDHGQNPWFINGYHNITRIDNVSGTPTTYVMDSSVLVDPPAPVNLNVLYDQELGGISCDWFNRIWVLNSYDNRVYMVLASNPSLPQTELQISPAINDFSYSLQGYGDWHGLQWFNKFGAVSLSAVGGEVTLSLHGVSNDFSIQDFKASYDFRKINEDFDGVNKIRDITLQQNIKRNDILFSKLIAPIAGTYDGDPLQLGTSIYEKIANYVANQGDVDTCNVPQLYSLHQMIDIPIDQYNFSYPSDIKRIMDLLSISLTRLKPTRSKFSKDFKKYNVASSGPNIGPLIDTATYIASAGEEIVVNIKYTTNFEKIELTPIPVEVLDNPLLSASYVDYPLSAFPLTTFPLSAYSGWGLDVPVYNYYFLYHYVAGYDNTQVEGVIDWDNTNTVLDENIASIDEWYKDGGLVDLIFRYHISNGLGLIRALPPQSGLPVLPQALSASYMDNVFFTSFDPLTIDTEVKQVSADFDQFIDQTYRVTNIAENQITLYDIGFFTQNNDYGSFNVDVGGDHILNPGDSFDVPIRFTYPPFDPTHVHVIVPYRWSGILTPTSDGQADLYSDITWRTQDTPLLAEYMDTTQHPSFITVDIGVGSVGTGVTSTSASSVSGSIDTTYRLTNISDADVNLTNLGFLTQDNSFGGFITDAGGDHLLHPGDDYSFTIRFTHPPFTPTHVHIAVIYNWDGHPHDGGIQRDIYTDINWIDDIPFDG